MESQTPNDPSVLNTSQADPPPPPVDNAHTTIGRAVKMQVIKACQGDVTSPMAARVVNHLVDVELERRKDALLACFNELERATKDVRKADKPDHVTYDPKAGTSAGQFTKDAWETLKKARERVERIEKAIELAIAKADYAKAFEIQQKQGNK